MSRNRPKRSNTAALRSNRFHGLHDLEPRVLLSAVPRPAHVVVVIEENHSFPDIIGSVFAPYINSLAQTGALFTQSFAVAHPSQPNYLALFSGSVQGTATDDIPTSQLTAPNLGASLISAGFTFTGYSESLPAAGTLDESDTTDISQNQYVRKHNPWSDWQNDVSPTANQLPSSVNQPFTAFPSDFTQLPDVSFVIPNEQNDMHDGTIAQGDAFLQTNLDAYTQWAKTHNSLLIITWDEDDSASGNHIPTIFSGASVKPGQYAETINHFSVLRTIEDMYNISHIGSSAAAAPITDVWTPALTGSFGAFTGSTIKGWAFAQDAGPNSVQIRYTIDANAPLLAAASISRSDLVAIVASANHGFAITLPQLAAGMHTIAVWAVDPATDVLLLLGTRSAVVASPTGNALPIGSVAPATTTLVKGWAFDSSTPSTAINVRIDIDGVAGTPFAAGINRPDLTPIVGTPNHGYSQILTLSPGAHRIDVYALDSTASTPMLLSRQIVGDPAPLGSLNPAIAATAKGWAFAAGLAGSPATVRLDIDTIPGTPTLAGVNRPDLTSLLGDPNFGFLITLPKLAAGAHAAKLWIIDPLTLTPTLIASTAFIAA